MWFKLQQIRHNNKFEPLSEDQQLEVIRASERSIGDIRATVRVRYTNLLVIMMQTSSMMQTSHLLALLPFWNATITWCKCVKCCARKQQQQTRLVVLLRIVSLLPFLAVFGHGSWPRSGAVVTEPVQHSWFCKLDLQAGQNPTTNEMNRRTTTTTTQHAASVLYVF